jgi:hypothetical protein
LSSEYQLISDILHFPVPCYWFKEDLRYEYDNDIFVNDKEASYDNDIAVDEACI